MILSGCVTIGKVPEIVTDYSGEYATITVFSRDVILGRSVKTWFNVCLHTKKSGFLSSLVSSGQIRSGAKIYVSGIPYVTNKNKFLGMGVFVDVDKQTSFGLPSRHYGNTCVSGELFINKSTVKVKELNSGSLITCSAGSLPDGVWGQSVFSWGCCFFIGSGLVDYAFAKQELLNRILDSSSLKVEGSLFSIANRKHFFKSNAIFINHDKLT